MEAARQTIAYYNLSILSGALSFVFVNIAKNPALFGIVYASSRGNQHKFQPVSRVSAARLSLGWNFLFSGLCKRLYKKLIFRSGWRWKQNLGYEKPLQKALDKPVKSWSYIN